jgi:hypothetical protein
MTFVLQTINTTNPFGFLVQTSFSLRSREGRSMNPGLGPWVACAPKGPKNSWILYNKSISLLCNSIANVGTISQPILLFLDFQIETENIRPSFFFMLYPYPAQAIATQGSGPLASHTQRVRLQQAIHLCASFASCSAYYFMLRSSAGSAEVSSKRYCVSATA